MNASAAQIGVRLQNEVYLRAHPQVREMLSV
jgi:hypothetical protein